MERPGRAELLGQDALSLASASAGHPQTPHHAAVMTKTFTSADFMAALNLNSRQAMRIFRAYLVANHLPQMRQGKPYTLDEQTYQDLLRVTRVSLECDISVQQIYAMKAGNLEALRLFLSLPSPAGRVDPASRDEALLGAIREGSAHLSARLDEVLEATRRLPRPISFTPPQ